MVATARLWMALLLGAATAPAQGGPDEGPTQAELRARRDATLDEPVFQAHDWIADYDRARETARESSRPVLAYFTRSYAACPPCEMVEGRVLSHERFADVATRTVLFVHVTTLVGGEPYPDLLRDKGFRGFPSVAFSDEAGSTIAAVSYTDLLGRGVRVADRMLLARGDRAAPPVGGGWS